MCSISGIYSVNKKPIDRIHSYLQVMNDLQHHRGPDGDGTWVYKDATVGFAHRRLAIIDLDTGDQPMADSAGNWIVFNGEIYNYLELRKELGEDEFQTRSDTEVILHSYQRWGTACIEHFKGMFAFAIWDEQNQKLFCARDRFGIKPFYYTMVDNIFYFASEAKALLPFLDTIETDIEGFKDYLTFQFCLNGKTFFKGIQELQPGYMLETYGNDLQVKQYWEVFFTPNLDYTEQYYEKRLDRLLNESVELHLRSDVPLGAYISGGLDSCMVSSLAQKQGITDLIGFTGKFSDYGSEFDESIYARHFAQKQGIQLYELDMTAQDFIDNIQNVIYHLDYPVAGPGAFPQYMVSQLAGRNRKVVLGGQGGDEIFGGYTRYLIAYFEQCIKAAIDGTVNNGNFIVTYESIIPNLIALRNYKPLLQEFWRDGLFEDMDRRYFRLINHAPDIDGEINPDILENYNPFDTFRSIFNGENVPKTAYFDRMTHFDFKTLLPALLHVEDRMSMAHGLESRVPLLDHELVEFAATIPANIKFKNGTMKHIFKKVATPYVPMKITARNDKMGFPTPFTEWVKGEAYDFVHSILTCHEARNRNIVDNKKVVDSISKESRFSRKLWGFLCLEIWQQTFHDNFDTYKKMLSGSPKTSIRIDLTANPRQTTRIPESINDHAPPARMV